MLLFGPDESSMAHTFRPSTPITKSFSERSNGYSMTSGSCFYLVLMKAHGAYLPTIKTDHQILFRKVKWLFNDFRIMLLFGPDESSWRIPSDHQNRSPNPFQKGRMAIQ
ncbi:hypothetical protein AVEN_43601-1 [Araneus ventricosus]|uniref:Uncharacterized protein n=1 Tax=Araneus ventricosus TaxID=182803 RepID=A0A4Y2GR62_ARAVE|nr:hypothetical protein AVEN_1043-1 [Araneus ventricosus]GBM54615.1 hypothetical protein AVEN_101961-1 [Araneus ventricosus]GBM54624.1 hypothetical protein AVEN_246757-1 [Araneus ventricosus]GBM54638.1 hypothetical protein AVEN_43601-1 [Araneus ventricosus]